MGLSEEVVKCQYGYEKVGIFVFRQFRAADICEVEGVNILQIPAKNSVYSATKGVKWGLAAE